MSNEWHFERSKPKPIDDLVSQQWQPIATVPLGELVICLWGHRTIGTQVFYWPNDVKETYAKYWMSIPPVPNDNERHS